MANSLITRITGWKKYFEQITGILIQGDPDAPPITWWNILWVRAQWKKAVILRIPHDKAEMGYRIGYWPMHGPLQLKIEVLHQQLVAVRLGQEECIFFAVNMLDEEIGLSVERITTTDDPDIGRTIRLI
jgi:hypothetical protein